MPLHTRLRRQSREAAIGLLITLAGLVPALAQPTAAPKQTAPKQSAPNQSAPNQSATNQSVPKQFGPPVQAQSPSTFSATTAADGTQTIDIRNVSYEVTNSHVPTRPPDERLLLRRTVHSKETVGDIGIDSTVTLEAWRLGDDPRNRPLYTINTTGTGGDTLDNALFVVSRGLEEVDWWSVYKLGSGQHLFDTYVPLVPFSITRDTVTARYAGLEVPPDDTKDTRLKQPNVIAVVTYASEDRVIREALLTADDPRQAALLRSFADVTRTLVGQEAPPPSAPVNGKSTQLPPRLVLSFIQNQPATQNQSAPPAPTMVFIPLTGDDLDLPRTQLPPRMHLIAFRR